MRRLVSLHPTHARSLTHSQIPSPPHFSDDQIAAFIAFENYPFDADEKYLGGLQKIEDSGTLTKLVASVGGDDLQAHRLLRAKYYVRYFVPFFV